MNFSSNISIDTIIGLIALILAICSAIYTWNSNRYSIELSNLSTRYTMEQNIIEFTIINTSNRPIRVQEVKIMKSLKEIHDNGFEPVEYDRLINEQNAEKWRVDHTQSIMGITFPSPELNPYMMNNDFLSSFYESEPFLTEVFLLPSESKIFSYYVNELPNKIVITTDKRIYHFKKQKSFFVNFNQHY